MPRRPWARLRHGTPHRRIIRDRRTQHRPFSRWRGDLCWFSRRDPRDAPRHGRGQGTTVIIGFGIDLCDIRRIEESLARYGERFTKRCFTETERAKSDGRAQRAASYAKRFAAKEACAKALGTGIRSGIFWRDMGVVNLASGKPTMVLLGGAAERLNELTPAGYEAAVHVTLKIGR